MNPTLEHRCPKCDNGGEVPAGPSVSGQATPGTDAAFRMLSTRLDQLRAERDSLREEHTRLVAEVKRIAAKILADDAYGMDRLAVEVDLRTAAVAAAPVEAPAEPPWPVLKPNMIVMVGSNPYHSFRVGGWEYGEEDVTVTLIPGGPVPPGAYGPDGNPLPAGPSPAASADPADIPPPVGEGAALIAATEQEIADALPADDATAAAESAAHAWRETARILARALDGSPAAPVQPEERGDARVSAQEPGSETGEYGTLLSQAAGFADQLRDREIGPHWFAGYGEVFRLAIAEIDRLRAALTNARATSADRLADRDKIAHDLIKERDEARAALATAERKAEHSAKERDEAKAWAVKLRGLLWDALMAPAPISAAVDVTGTLVERAKLLRADLATAERERDALEELAVMISEATNNDGGMSDREALAELIQMRDKLSEEWAIIQAPGSAARFAMDLEALRAELADNAQGCLGDVIAIQGYVAETLPTANRPGRSPAHIAYGLLTRLADRLRALGSTPDTGSST